MNKNKLSFLIQFMFLMPIGTTLGYSFPQGEVKMQRHDIENMIVLAEKGDVSAAESLAHATVHLDSKKIDDDIIRRISALLDSPSGPIRLWAAAAMGNFDIRAREYAPRLQKMVAEEACNMTGLTAADAASYSLRKIGIKPVPSGCKILK